MYYIIKYVFIHMHIKSIFYVIFLHFKRAGEDNICNQGCSESTKQLMKMWSQCCLRRERNNSRFRLMSNDTFIRQVNVFNT